MITNKPISYFAGLLFLSLSTQISANESSPTILVLDASGSMWGQIDGKSKIEIAREVVADTVVSWDKSQPLGLMAYGHNRKGDCADIELLIAPAKVDADLFSSTANKLSPKGKTPLSAAVQMAATNMAFEERKATVILISDGKETCDLDPCAVGKSLETTGVDFTAHIIGFDVSKEDSIGLRCLAEQTGGAYIDANDAEQLNDALAQTRAVVTDTAPSIKTPAGVEVPNEVFAETTFEAKWNGPANSSDFLIIRSEDGATNHNVAYIGGSGLASPTIMTAPAEAGTYRVHYSLRDSTSLASAKLYVVTPEATIEAPDSMTAGTEFEVTWSGPKNEFDSLRIVDLEGNQTNEYVMIGDQKVGKTVSLTAPVELGEYVVQYTTLSKKILAQAPIRVTEAMATVKVPEEVYAGAPIDVVWTGPKNDTDRLEIYDNKGKKLNNHAILKSRKYVSPAVMTAPEESGDYVIVYLASNKKIIAEAALTVLPVVASLSAPAVVSAGAEYQVDWYGPEYEGDSIYTYSSSGKDMREYIFLRGKNATSPATLKAPKTPGTYELRYRLKKRTILATHKLEVK